MLDFGEINKASKLIPGLDALRTLAIVGVTLFHMFPQAVVGGYLGVVLFFVLSGFLLAYTSKKDWQTGKFTVFSYYKKRLLRIYPTLFLVVFVSVGVFSIVTPKMLAGLHQELLSIFLGYNNWWQIAQNADYFTRMLNTSPFTHLWFMGIELQYYFVWPFIFGLYVLLEYSLGGRVAISVMGVIAALAAGVMPCMYTPTMDVTRLYYGTDTRIYALLWGAILGLTYDNEHRVKYYRERNIWALVILFVALVVTLASYALLDGRNPLLYRGGMLGITLLFCLVLYIITRQRGVGGLLLDNGLFTWLGRRSYSIFLWQYPVLYVFRHFKWTNSPYYALAEIAVILLLSMGSDFICDTLVAHNAEERDIKLFPGRGVIALVLCVVSLGLIGRGCYGLAHASTMTRAQMQAKLQADLATKAKALESAKQESLQSMRKMICIGDSVMLSASSALRELFPDCYVDAEISRYVGGGQEVVKKLKNEGKLGKVVVISLGTNGPIAGAERYEVQTLGLIKDLGSERQIFWVNVHGPHLSWQDTNNEYIAKLAAEHPNITVVDWHKAATVHPEWLDGDDVHPTVEGAHQYALLVQEAVKKKMLGGEG